MLDRAPQMNGLLGQLGLLGPGMQADMAEGYPGYGRDFALQLHALMASGRLPGSALENAKAFQGLDMDSFSALSEHLPFEVDPNSDQDLFSQLSDWLADQGIVTDAVRGTPNGVSDLVGSLKPAGQTPLGLKLDKSVASLDEKSLLRFDGLDDATQQGLALTDSLEASPSEGLAHTEGMKPLADEVSGAGLAEGYGIEENLDEHNIKPTVQDEVHTSLPVDQADVESLTEKAQAMMAAHLDGKAVEQDVTAGESLKSSELRDAVVELEESVHELAVLDESEQLSEEVEDGVEAPLSLSAVLASESDSNKLNIETQMGQQKVGSDAVNAEVLTETEESVADELMTPVFAGQNVTQSQQAAASMQNSAMGSATTAPQAQNMMRQAQASLGQRSGTDAQTPKGNVEASAGQAKTLQEAVSQLMMAQQQNSQSQQLQSLQNLNNREAMAQLQQEMLRQSEAKQVAIESAEESLDTTASGQATDRKTGLPSLASIHYPMRHPQWAQAVGKRVVFMANNQLQQAQISLSPEKLGPIQIRLQVDRDQMISVSMTAQHGTTREALEQAIPRLKEMLEEAGISFDSVNVDEESVFEQAANQQQDSKNGRGSNAPGLVDGNEANDSKPSETRILETDNMVDYYA
jgi:flagellar hook-length control protein FliK